MRKLCKSNKNLYSIKMLLLVVSIIFTGLITFCTTNTEKVKKIGMNIMAEQETQLEKNVNTGIQPSGEIDNSSNTEIFVFDTNSLSGEEIIAETASASVKYITGTVPFDDNDEPGNDSSATNHIVRSFDDVIYSISTGFNSNEQQEDMYLYVVGKLPNGSKGKLQWDLENMYWETEEVSEDGATFKGKIKLSNIQDAGIEGGNLIINVLGAENGYKFIPEIYAWVATEENNTFDVSSINKIENIQETTVSAAQKYNVELASDRNDLNRRIEDVKLNGKKTSGRLYGATVSLQLYNDNIEKGLKGIELPTGNITFDMDLIMKKTDSKGNEAEVNEYSPVLWNYKINSIDAPWRIEDDSDNEGRTKNYGFRANYSRWVPYGTLGQRDISVYDSGNVEMIEQSGNISVTVSDYSFDGIFPTKRNTEDIGKNIGYFSTIYFQVFVPDSEKLEELGCTYNLYLTDEYMQVNGKEIEQINKEDDKFKLEKYKKYSSGKYDHSIELYRTSDYFEPFSGTSKNEYLTSRDYGLGNAKAIIGHNFYARFVIHQGPNNDEGTEITKVEKFIKFDGDGIEPIPYDDNSNNYFMPSKNMEKMKEPLKWEVKYIAKTDGESWSDEDERNNTSIESNILVQYSSMEQLKADGKICIGIYLVSIEGGKIEIPLGNSRENYIEVRFKVKETANVNSTYGIIQDDIFEAGDNVVQLGNNSYEKTQYNSVGECIDGHGLHSKYHNGQTVLAVKAVTTVDKTAIISVDNEKEKNYYNLSNDEYNVIFKLQPRLTIPYAQDKVIENATVKLIDTLPNGLTYKENVTKNAENVIGPEIINNEDGTTTLIWEIRECSNQVLITPIKYVAEINRDIQNGTQLENKVVIECEDAGFTEISERTDVYAITVIDTASHRLSKRVTEDVIEENGIINYTIEYWNNKSTSNTIRIVDILPYNGDERGSNFEGEYTLKSINIEESEGLKVYITDQEEVRTNEAYKNENLETSTVWTQETQNNINKKAKAIAIEGEIQGKGKVTVKVRLQTTGNKDGNVYMNNTICNVSDEENSMISSTTKTEVISRNIEGIVWLDSNLNGIMDNEEEKLKDIEVSLLDKEGKTVIDSTGKEVKVKTNQDGKYIFENLLQGEYIIKININNYYVITQKNVGEDIKINSKINQENKQSDIISELNNMDSSYVKNMNAGLIVQKTDVSVNKQWVDEENKNNKRPESVKLQIKNGTNIIAEKIVTQDNNWSHTFTNLDKYDTQGNEIKYTIDEEEVKPGDLKFYSKAIENNTIINTFTVPNEKTQITITKVWEDLENEAKKRPESIELLVKNGEKIEQKQVVKEEDGWSYTFTDLAKYDEKGNEIKYTVDEAEVNPGDLKFYIKVIENNKIINKFTVSDEKVEITVNKQWIDQENANEKRPESVKLQIKNGTNIVAEKVVTKDNNWSYTFTDLAKYDEKGNEIKYTIDETEVKPGDLKFYTKSIQENTIINTFTVPDEKIEITATKVWEDFNNKYNKRPESIELIIKNGDKVVQKQVVKEEDKWSYTFANLAKYDENGKEILYTVDESESHLEYYDKIINGNVITNIFKVKAELATSITKKSNKEEILEENEKIKYNITYRAELDKYIGNAEITLIDELPYEIDEKKSKLDGGIYNKENKTITWIENIEKINTFDNGKKEISIQKNIEIVYTNYEVEDATALIENKIIAKTFLDTTGKEEIKQNKQQVTLNKKAGKIVVNHYLKGTTEKLAESTVIEGKIGEKYTTEPNDSILKKYNLVEEPKNKEGTYKNVEQEVNYYYEKKNGKVIVEYIEKENGKKLLENSEIIDEIEKEYITKPEKIKYYKLVESTKNTKGKYKVEEQKVTYYYEKLEFNFSVNKEISNIAINGVNKKNLEEIAKLEVDSKKIKNTNLELTYTIKVKNTGEIAGSCTLIEEIPQGFTIKESKKSKWVVKDARTAKIDIEELQPNEEKMYSITIEWNNSKDSFGTITNTVKITDMKNDAGFEDINKKDNQDSADFVLGLRTGKEINLLIIGILMMLIGSAIIITGAKIPIKQES